MTDTHDSPDSMEHAVGHEHLGVDTGAVLRWIVVIGVLIAGTFWLVASMIGWFATGTDGAPEERADLVRVKPRGPDLDPDQPATLRRLNREQRERLGSWNWVDRDAGIASIPIEVAMERLVEKGAAPFGLPEEGGAETPAENGADSSRESGESSDGRSGDANDSDNSNDGEMP